MMILIDGMSPLANIIRSSTNARWVIRRLPHFVWKLKSDAFVIALRLLEKYSIQIKKGTTDHFATDLFCPKINHAWIHW